jgi:putative transposase
MKKQHIKLTTEERKELQGLLSKGDLKVRVQKRAMGLQMMDKGLTFQAIRDFIDISHISLGKWAKRFKVERLKMLYDKPRSGRPVGLNGEERAKVTALACTKPPEGYARWSLRLLSDRLVELNILENISHTEVGNILKKMNFSLTEKDNGVSES